MSFAIFPLKWQYVLITALPEKLMVMLDSPIPYIIGINDENGTNSQNILNLYKTYNSELAIVFLDQKIIKLKTNIPEKDQLMMSFEDSIIRKYSSMFRLFNSQNKIKYNSNTNLYNHNEKYIQTDNDKNFSKFAKAMKMWIIKNILESKKIQSQKYHVI